MSTETNQDVPADVKAEGEGSQPDWKAQIENLNATIGTLKRELKDATKAKETPQKTTEPSDLDYGQKAYLRSTLGVKGADEIQLTKDYMKRTGSDVDALENDDIYLAKLEKLRTTKLNEAAADAASKGKGNTSSSSNVDYWLAKGEHPPANAPRELKEKYVEAKRNQGANNKMFYND